MQEIRAWFDGPVALSGAIACGRSILAAQALGADLAYLGTRFIATQESDAPAGYKDLLVSERSADLIYTGGIAGVPANWLRASIAQNGLDPDDLPKPLAKGKTYEHLPEGVRPWKTVWSAGQGIDLIQDIPPVAELVRRLRAEYVAACAIPDMADAARLADAAFDQPAR